MTAHNEQRRNKLTRTRHGGAKAHEQKETGKGHAKGNRGRAGKRKQGKGNMRSSKASPPCNPQFCKPPSSIHPPIPPVSHKLLMNHTGFKKNMAPKANLSRTKPI
eukprot:363782-Chlamydomonas_euryale.AAC.2